MQGSRRLLIVSNGPPPTPEHDKVEGGGLRCWGLARGLKANSPGLDITMTYGEGFRKEPFTPALDGIRLSTWNPGSLIEQVAAADAVIASYCMGATSVRIADALRRDQQLILDCYVPIYVEVSARGSADPSREQRAFRHDSTEWNHTLRRGDLFLCASPAQKPYYFGVLSAVGRVNPINYGESLIEVVPYGIYRDEPVATDRPIQRLTGGRGRTVLWFGGIYPWFDLRSLIDAVALANREQPTNLVIVGARNPFVCHPDFVAKFDELEAYARLPRHQDFVFLHDWVEFQDRANWYLDADLVVTMNREGDENMFAWRTRLVDFTWANLPIVTNGGDPLGEALISSGSAARFPSLAPAAMAETLVDLFAQPDRLRSLRRSLAEFKTSLYWDTATAQLARRIEAGYIAPDRLLVEAEEPAPAPAVVAEPPTPPAAPEPPMLPKSRMSRLIRLARRVPVHVRAHGLRATAGTVRRKVRNKVLARLNAQVAAEHAAILALAAIPAPPAPIHEATPTPVEPTHETAGAHEPRIVVMSHMLDQSGAPYILVDVLEQMALRGLTPDIDFYSYPPIEQGVRKYVDGLGFDVRPLGHFDVPPLGQGDVVLMNTTGFTEPVRDGVFTALEQGRIARVVWFIHEDEPDRSFPPAWTERLRRLLLDGRLVMIVPAQGTLKKYRAHFGAKILRDPYRVCLPESHERARTEDDFDSLHFVLSGTLIDSRKGQLTVFYAFASFLREFGRKSPDRYRDFTLTYIGLEKDFVSRQILNHRGAFGNRLICHPKVSREESLAIIRAANMTVCYSLSETGPLFVAEGMMAGHPILRNDCSGVDEQMEHGRNGYRLDSLDYDQLVDTIELVLNRETTTNADLLAMSDRSRAIIRRQRENDYRLLIGEIERGLGRSDQFVPAIPAPHFATNAARVRN